MLPSIFLRAQPWYHTISDKNIVCVVFPEKNFFYTIHYKLGIPIDRVPTSKSCVFSLGIKFLFFHLTVSWSLPVAKIIFLKSSQIQSGGFTNLLCKSVKCLEIIESALQRKRSGILLSPATNLLSVQFHIVDKYLHSLII